MIVSDSQKLAFIHIHRTGGTTIRELLLQHIPDAREIFSMHSHENSGLAEMKKLKDYRKFAFIRNPWERIWSWYTVFCQYGPRREFESFSLEEYLRNYDKLSVSNGIDKDFRFNQLDYIQNNKKELTISFVGRYESYQKDVCQFFETLGIHLDEIPKLNKSNSVLYSDEYSSNTREMVEKLCAKDIAYFGYKFK